MRFLILDPCNGDLSGELYVLGQDGSVENHMRLGYVPEVRFHAPTRELIVLDTDVYVKPARYYLKLFDTAPLVEKLVREIPPRPMYAGFSGRSVAGSMSASARYVYFLNSGPVVRHADDDLTFPLTVVRYDRTRDRVEIGQLCVESCHIDFGVVGEGDEELFFHLSCEYPSTIALGKFGSPESHMLRFVQLPGRSHGLEETNGSWLDRERQRLYCVDRQGTIYGANLLNGTTWVVASLGLDDARRVPVHQICGARGILYVGVAAADGEQGAGLVSEIWSVAADSGALLGMQPLPHPVVNFSVLPDGASLVAVNAHSQTVYRLALGSGEEIWRLNAFGQTPTEVILIHP